MTELEEFWKKRVVEEKLLPKLQSKGLNMLIHFAKMQFALLDTEEAKSQALRTIHLLISHIYDSHQEKNQEKNYQTACKTIGKVILKIVKEKNLSN